MKYNKNTRYQVLTPDGFKDFSGITKLHKEDLVKIILENDSYLICTYDHQVFANDEWCMSISVFEGDVIKTEDGEFLVKEIIHHVGSDDVYDLIDVQDTHSYYTNKVLSHNCDLIYIDEAAFIENDLEFYESTYPVISSGANSRVIMTTTPKGIRGMFYNLWQEALAGKNYYATLKVTWERHPKRDQKWKDETLANIGVSRFKQEFEVNFRGSSNTMLDAGLLERLQWRDPQRLDGSFRVYEDYNPLNKYCIVCDPAGGLGRDYSVITVYDVTQYPYKIAAMYRDNNISPLILPNTLMSIGYQYNECPILVEANNDVGGQVTYILFYELEYPNVVLTSFSEKDIGAQKVGGNARQTVPGVKTSAKVKAIGCANLKAMIENNYLQVDVEEMIDELSTFIITATGTFKADDDCHDDTVMTLVLFAWFVKQEFFKGYIDRNISDDLFGKTVRENSIEHVMPFGYICHHDNNDFFPSLGFNLNDVNTPYHMNPHGMEVTTGFRSVEDWFNS